MGEKPPRDSGEDGQRDRARDSPQSSIRGHRMRRTCRRFSRQRRECLFDLDVYVSDVLPSALPVLFETPVDQMPCSG